MFICICMYVYVWLYTHVCVYIFTCTHNVYACMDITQILHSFSRSIFYWINLLVTFVVELVSNAMYVHIYIYIYIYIYIHTYIYIYTFLQINTHTHIHTDTYKFVYRTGFTLIYKYVCIYICTYKHICMYIHLYIHTCKYTHIHTTQASPLFSRSSFPSTCSRRSSSSL